MNGGNNYNLGMLASFATGICALLNLLCRTVKIYGPSNKRDELEPLLKWATPGQKGFPPRNGADGSTASQYSSGSGSNAMNSGPGASQYLPRPGSYCAPSASKMMGGQAAGANTQSQAQMEAVKKQQEAFAKQQEALAKAAELRQVLNSLEKVDDEGRRNGLLDALCSQEDILNLPVHPNPPGVESGELKVDLLKHQVRRQFQDYILYTYFTNMLSRRVKPLNGTVLSCHSCIFMLFMITGASIKSTQCSRRRKVSRLSSSGSSGLPAAR